MIALVAILVLLGAHLSLVTHMHVNEARKGRLLARQMLAPGQRGASQVTCNVHLDGEAIVRAIKEANLRNGRGSAGI